MSKDRFTVTLRCPNCGREGVAHLWQEDAYRFVFGSDQSTHVDSLTDGFVVVDAKSRIDAHTDFQCVDHPVSAMVKR